MRSIHIASTLLAAALSFGTIVPVIHAAQPVQSDSSANAALRYWVIFSQISQDRAAKLRDIDFDKILTVEDARAALANAEFAVENNELITSLIEATRIPRCDFGIDMSQGPFALMPHLGQIRTCSRLLRLDARRLLLEGKHDEAAGRIAAILRLANHVSVDKIMISSLVGVAVAELGFSEGTKIIAAGKLSPATAVELLTALGATSDLDPMLLRSAVANEGKVFPDWIERQVDLPGGLAKVNELSSVNTGEEKKSPVPVFTASQIKSDLPKLRGAYENLNRAWDAAEPAAESASIEKRCIAGEFGELAKVWLPSMGRAYKTAKRFVDERQEFAKLLESAK